MKTNKMKKIICNKCGAEYVLEDGQPEFECICSAKINICNELVNNVK